MEPRRRSHLARRPASSSRRARGRSAAVARDALDLVGIVLHGPRNAVDKVLEGAALHP